MLMRGELFGKATCGARTFADSCEPGKVGAGDPPIGRHGILVSQISDEQDACSNLKTAERSCRAGLSTKEIR
jgi:hypothetical protein